LSHIDTVGNNREFLAGNAHVFGCEASHGMADTHVPVHKPARQPIDPQVPPTVPFGYPNPRKHPSYPGQTRSDSAHYIGVKKKGLNQGGSLLAKEPREAKNDSRGLP